MMKQKCISGVETTANIENKSRNSTFQIKTHDLWWKRQSSSFKNSPIAATRWYSSTPKQKPINNTTTSFMTQTKNKNKRFNYQNSSQRQNRSWGHGFQIKTKKYKWNKHRRFAQTLGTHSHSHNHRDIAQQNKNKALPGWRKSVTTQTNASHLHPHAITIIIINVIFKITTAINRLNHAAISFQGKVEEQSQFE